MAYAKEEDLPVLMEIPFDRRIAEIYSMGEVVVEVMPEWKEKFSEAVKEALLNKQEQLHSQVFTLPQKEKQVKHFTSGLQKQKDWKRLKEITLLENLWKNLHTI